MKKPLEPGAYAMLCPIGGPDGPHYELGQLAEFELQPHETPSAGRDR